MSLITLLIISIFIIVFITILFIIATNRGYKVEHTIDPLPKNNIDDADQTIQKRSDH